MKTKKQKKAELNNKIKDVVENMNTIFSNMQDNFKEPDNEEILMKLKRDQEFELKKLKKLNLQYEILCQ